MARWAFSVLASNFLIRQVNHAPGVVEAASEAEATGKALAIARRVYPTAEGWRSHDVAVQSAETVVEPEAACRYEPGV